MLSQITFTFVLSTALLSAASPAIDPTTVRSISPAQSSVYSVAEQAYLASVTVQPAFMSVVSDLATNPAALSAVEGVDDYLDELPTASYDVAALNSLADTLPTPAADIYRSLISAELSIASSVLNNVVKRTGGVSSSTSAAAKASSSSSTSSMAETTAGSTSTATSATQNAAATPVFAQAAGLALGVFGAAVALL